TKAETEASAPAAGFGGRRPGRRENEGRRRPRTAESASPTGPRRPRTRRPREPPRTAPVPACRRAAVEHGRGAGPSESGRRAPPVGPPPPSDQGATAFRAVRPRQGFHSTVLQKAGQTPPG